MPLDTPSRGFFNAQNIYYKKLDIVLKNIVLEIQGGDPWSPVHDTIASSILKIL